jgi:shikimate 5-dehydrogenase/shikimate kinase/3-dehydroquinate dehydratase
MAYSPDASLVLVGFFGAGKRTLGIIASMALHRTFIHFDNYFAKKVGSTPHAYLKTHSSAQYREIEYDITEDLLTNHGSGCVIVGIGAMGGQRQKVLLENFARSRPVVYVRRERADIQRMMFCNNDQFQFPFRTGNEFYESCSNFDFYNVSQETYSADNITSVSYLRLKETAASFKRFLFSLYDIEIDRLYSVDPLNSAYTYMLHVPPAWLKSSHVNHKELESGADAINLAVRPEDGNTLESLSRDIAMIWRYSRAPVIFDVKLNSRNVDRNEYFRLLEAGLRIAPDMMMVYLGLSDELIQHLLSRRGSTKFIASYHVEHGWQPSHISDLCRRAIEFGFSAVRITSAARSPSDNFHITSVAMDLTKSLNFPIIAYNTGQLGRASVCFNQILSPVLLPSVPGDGVFIQDAQTALYSCFVLPKRVFTIFGNSLRCSPSPAMHNAAYIALGMPHVYQSLESDEFEDIWSLLDNEEHCGVAISIPYKTKALSLLDEISPEARDIQAVNTILMERSSEPEDGKSKYLLKGYNTDYIGIRECVHRNMSPANAIREGSTALIIGAGGMARAAIYALFELGMRDIFIYNRTVENANSLANYYNQWAVSRPASKSGHAARLHVLPSLESDWPTAMRRPTVIVSCIPSLDRHERSHQFILPDNWLKSTTGGVFIDVCSIFSIK